jgi:hypothetical protein
MGGPEASDSGLTVVANEGPRKLIIVIIFYYVYNKWNLFTY